MTAPENFVSRWARLKREVTPTCKIEPVVEAPQPATAVTPGAGSVPVQHGSDAAIDEAFDPASLPSIEAIASDTDIRAFLHSRVPAELTRVALRRAWASDPAIRDFIGIAENQWDFNDPDAMPGFGPLWGTDNLPGLQQALGNSGKLAQTFAELPVPGEQALSNLSDRKPTSVDRSAGRTLDGPSVIDTDIGGLAAGSGGEGTTVGSDRVAEANDVPPNRRSHGSALPRVKI
jgi:hypothetical protein